MGNTVDLASGAKQEWLGESVYQVPEVQISEIRSWPFISAMSYHRSGGEAIWRGDRHRIVLTLDPLLPILVQIEQGRTPANAACSSPDSGSLSSRS